MVFRGSRKHKCNQRNGFTPWRESAPDNLRKIYFQSGSGRKENALHRGPTITVVDWLAHFCGY